MTCKPTSTGQKYGNLVLNSNSPVFNVDFEPIFKRIRNPVDRFDRERLVSVTQGLNQTLRIVDLSNYPYTQSRISQTTILYPEVGDFLIQSGYGALTTELIIGEFQEYISNFTSPELESVNFVPNLVENTPENPNDLPVPTEYVQMIEQLESYYEENLANTIAGGFCGAFANPFDQILKKVQDSRIGQLLSQILGGFDINSLINQMGTLEDKLLSIVDGLKGTMMQQLENVFNRAVASDSTGLLKMISKTYRDARTFYENFSTDNLKQQIQGFVKNSIAQFEQLTPENILLLIFRFCQFSELIQSFMKTPVQTLNNDVENYAQQYEIIQGLGLRETQTAVNAGAFRISTQGTPRNNGVATARRDQYNAARPPVPGSDTTPSIYNPELTGYENYKIDNLDKNGFPGYFKFNDGVINMHNRRGVKSAYEGAGYKEVKREVWEKLTIISREMGKEFSLNSAYRSPQYNRRVGGGSGSTHLSGEAVDVNVRGWTDAEIQQFIALASAVGFGGIGGYGESDPYMIHLDIGPRRIWGQNGSSSTVGKFKFADDLRRHQRNGYANITPEPVDRTPPVQPEGTTGPF